MKKYKKQLIKRRMAFLSKCPKSGGYCLNPMCTLGCIEQLF